MTIGRVIVVEDNDLFRTAMKSLIEGQTGLEVVAEADSGDAALDAIRRVPADLVLLDLRLPDTHGYELLQRIRAEAELKILVVTLFESDETVAAVLRHGAHGYCTKDASRRELLDAVRRTLAGECCIVRTARGYPSEKREDDRLGCVNSVSWTYFNREPSYPGTLRNCSRAGCYFESAQSVSPGATINLRMDALDLQSAPSGGKHMRWNVLAVVKWCQKVEDRYGVGVKYLQ
jgi:CheY-like chemotaxis protein